MYNTTPDDLARIANDLGQMANKYTAGSQELDQHITSLDHTASHLLYDGAQPWVGVASEAFQGAWTERRSRLQQASQLLTQAAQHLTRFAQTIDEYLPQLRLDQQLMQSSTSHLLAPDDQFSILSGETQAQNAILMAMQALNSQMEELAYEVRDCPEEQDESSPAWDNDPLTGKRNYNNPGGPGGNNVGNEDDENESARDGNADPAAQDTPEGENVPPYATAVAQYGETHNGAAQTGYVGNRPYANDGRGGGEVLPRTTADGQPITYREYDVHPYTPGVNRGAERIVIGSNGNRWYTGDHYQTFTRF